MTRDATRLHVACGWGRLCMAVACDDGEAPACSACLTPQPEASESAAVPWTAANMDMAAIVAHSRQATRALVPTLDRVSSWVPRAVGEARVAYI